MSAATFSSMGRMGTVPISYANHGLICILLVISSGRI